MSKKIIQKNTFEGLMEDLLMSDKQSWLLSCLLLIKTGTHFC